MNREYIFQIIGQTTIFYATLDFLVTRFIIDMASLQFKATEKGFRDTTTLGQKLRIIEKWNDEDVISVSILNEVKLHLEDAILLSQERNRFMHDQWLFDPKDLTQGFIKRISFTDLTTWNTESNLSDPYCIEDFNKLLERIAKQQISFSVYLDKLKLIVS